MTANVQKVDDKKPVRFSVAIKDEKYQQLINETLGDKELARQFVADISSVVGNNYKLQSCDARTILTAGLVACSMKLPLAPTLGFAYVVPYDGKAQFQIGWKGLVQLAQRSGQFKRLGVRDVHDGEWVGQDEFGEDLFKFDHKFDDKPIIGYYAYFELTNGFKKSVYWTKEQCEKHGSKYSKAHSGKNRGGEFDNWTSMFDIMAEKTVMKQLLSKYAPLSTELQKAIVYDQAIVGMDGTPNYVDNEPEIKPSGQINNVADAVATDK
jgi:recombination protein RecT